MNLVKSKCTIFFAIKVKNGQFFNQKKSLKYFEIFEKFLKIFFFVNKKSFLIEKSTIFYLNAKKMVHFDFIKIHVNFSIFGK